jgi:CRP/FNR family transcriptional regulator
MSSKAAATIFPSCHAVPTVSCAQCRLSAICLPLSLHVEDIDKVNEIIQRGRPLQKGQHLYHDNDPFNSIYAVRSGSIKTVAITDDGQEQVTGFYLPGEILGVDGVGSQNHCNSAVALETTAICEIPFNLMEDLATSIPRLQRHLFQILGREIRSDQQLITLLSKSSAEEKIATFLLSISSRNHRRRLSATAFRLPMSRADIGNYLGLTVETVSRCLSRLQKQNVIQADKREIVINDLDALREMANIGQHPSNCD